MISTNLRKAAVTTALAVGLMGSATAVPMINVSPIGYENDPASLLAVQAAEAAFLLSLQPGALTETFEGMTVATNHTGQSESIYSATTGVTFKSEKRGESGIGAACDDDGFKCSDGLAILNDDESPFGGRFPMPALADNNNWLDSMDAEEFSMTLSPGYNAIGFYMTDPNDASGRFEISSSTGTSSIDFGKVFGNTALFNGAAFYITIYDLDDNIETVTIFANSQVGRNDGFGIDNVTVGRVPEPGTLALLGLGIAGLAAARRRQKA